MRWLEVAVLKLKKIFFRNILEVYALAHCNLITDINSLERIQYCSTILYLIQNSQAVKKECGPEKGYGEKRCEIQGGGQEMAVMVG